MIRFVVLHHGLRILLPGLQKNWWTVWFMVRICHAIFCTSL